MATLSHSAVVAAACESGFALCGVTEPGASEHIAFLERWLEKGLHGSMGWLERPDSVARRADLRGTMTEVVSVIVVADEYGDPDRGRTDAPPDRDPNLARLDLARLDHSPPDHAPPGRGVIARYARGRDYHRVLVKKLHRLAGRLDDLAGRAVLARPYTDTGPILERELARRAGLGWFGRNTMLIHPRRGSYFLLGVLLVDVSIELSVPFEGDRCGSCRACLDACPTGALLGRDADGAPVIDATRCISYLTIELRGSIPEELRPGIGNRIFGCDICQEVCPFNARFAPPSGDPAYAPRASAGTPGTDRPSLVALMAMTEEQWDGFTRGSPIRRAGYEGLRRNVAVALGNWGTPEARAALETARNDTSAVVREHVEWAIGRCDP